MTHGRPASAGLDPHVGANPLNEAFYFLYDRLARPVGDGTLEPLLAESWESDETASRWTFRLRPGVRFHDGTPFSSRDVAYTIRYALDTREGITRVAVTGVDPDGIETPDDLTVVVPLREPNADFPLVISQDFHILSADDPNRAGNGIGTGPFRLERLDAENVTTLVPHGDYWAGAPALGSVEIYAIADSEARINALLAGQIDYVVDVGTAARAVEQNPDLVVQDVPSGAWTPMNMRADVPPFDDPRIRLAMKLVVDRPTMVQAVLQGRGEPAYDNPIWPRDLYALTATRVQDVARARTLLAEAGHRDGLAVVLHTSTAYPDWTPLSVTYQQMAAEAGIDVELAQVPADGYEETIVRVEPFTLGAWSQRPAPLILPDIFASDGPNNETFWSNQEFDALLLRAKAEVDLDRRRAYYQDAQRILMDDGPSIIPFFANDARGLNRNLTGITPDRPHLRNIPWSRVAFTDG
jgi:peptide/nickel transport system substrate-binding protein